jgi:GNAT superfamily N-acetyltransferase
MSIASDVELLEAEAWAQMHEAWAREVPGATCVHRWGRAASLVTPSVDAVAVNRVIGLGCDEALDREQLTAVRDFYRANGRTPWFLEWSPEAQLAEEDLLEAAGGRIRDRQAKLFARLADTRLPTETGLIEVVRVSRDTGSTFRDLVGPILGVPEAGRAGIVAAIGQPGWYYYLALADGQAVAGAAMFSDGKGAWFGLSATVPAHRNAGAQTALLSRRIRDARAMGCHWVSAETHPTSAERNPSLRNMARAGMQVLYLRPWYRFDEPAPVSRHLPNVSLDPSADLM